MVKLITPYSMYFKLYITGKDWNKNKFLYEESEGLLSIFNDT